MYYRIIFLDEVEGFLQSLDDKSKRICRNNLKKLKYPYPGRGPGNKKKVIVDGEECYRLHIARKYTAFYLILEEDKLVRVFDLMTIEKAHKKYD